MEDRGLVLEEYLAWLRSFPAEAPLEGSGYALCYLPAGGEASRPRRALEAGRHQRRRRGADGVEGSAMTGKLGGFDRFRLPAALQVIAVHTGPLLSVSPLANDLITDIWGRIAVPFFFAVSGWFLVPRLEREGAAALGPFLKKILGLYALSALLYQHAI